MMRSGFSGTCFALLACFACGGPTSGKDRQQVAPSSQEAGRASTEPAAPRSAPKKRGTPQPKLPLGSVVLETPPRAPITLTVEVASKDQERQQGMMFREQLGDDEGMLFIFPTERRNSFWMHNTLIPLDMLFIDSEWKVVGIVERAEPLTDDPRGVPKMSQYVLEVNGGFAERNGLSTDTIVRFTPPPGLNP